MTLRVLQISQNYHVRGGSDVMFFQNMDLLQQHGHQVIPFAAKSDKNISGPWNHYFPVAADFDHPGLTDAARFIYSRPARKAIEKVISEHRPGIAHLHIYYGKLTASILGPLRKAGIPVVQTLHEYKLICPVYRLVSKGVTCEACEGCRFWRALPRRCNRNSLARTCLSVAETYVSHRLGTIRNVRKFIAVSDFLREKHIQYGVPAGKISTIRNWVDVSRIRPETGPGQYVLYFGRMEALKGIFTLLDAAAGLSHIRFLLVGDGESRPDVVDRIQKNRWTHIQWLGFKQGRALQDLIRNSICTLMPSEWYEPFPTTVLESFAHARPVIGAAIGGIPEMITHGKDGLLYPSGDARSLQEHILWMHNHPHQAVQMGQAGREKLETSYDAGRYLRELLMVYHNVLGT